VANNDGVGNLFTALASVLDQVHYPKQRQYCGNRRPDRINRPNACFGRINLGGSALILPCIMGGATASWEAARSAAGGYPFFNNGGYITQSITTEDLLIGGLPPAPQTLLYRNEFLTGQLKLHFRTICVNAKQRLWRKCFHFRKFNSGCICS